jgi:PTS system nitrogen regulatory IIA component
MKLERPVDFDSVDDQPVDIVMMLLALMGAGADYLKALARVARILRTDSVVEALRRTNEPARLYAILTQPMAATRAA